MYHLDIGVIVPLEQLLQEGTGELENLDFNTCQISAWNVDILTERERSKAKSDN